MKRIIFITLLFFSLASNCQNIVFASMSGAPINTTNWNLQGNAIVGNVMSNNLSEILLTSTGYWQYGSVFYNTPINANFCKRWTVEFDFRMFDGNFPSNLYGNGADGIAFCYLDTPPSAFINGYGIGIPLTANGLKVCFDTYPNCTLNYVDAPSIEIRWGQGYDECWAQPTLRNNSTGFLSFLRGDFYNHAKITYNNGLINVYVNNTLYLQGFQQINFPGYLGFTSSTGAGYDNNSIKNIFVYADIPPSHAGNDLTLSSGQAGIIGAPPINNYVYNWSPSIGLNNSSVASPTFSFINNSNQIQVFQYVVSTSLLGSESCYSTDTVIIRVLPLNSEVNVNVCHGESYLGHSINGTYVDTLVSVIGYDSIMTLHLQVLPKGIINNDSIVCSQSLIPLNANEAMEYNWFPRTNLLTTNSSSTLLNLDSSQTIYLSSSYSGTNLVVNGDFESGNTGFVSSYPYCNTNNCLYTIAGYAINNNANYNHSLFYGVDHTSGSGNFMIINGAIQNATVWKETIPVTPNTDYYFGAFISSLMTVDPAFIQFSINGQLLGNIFPAPSNINVWDRFFTSWNSGTNNIATIEIVDVNPVTSGNDWGIDDIFFSQKYSCLDSVRIMIPQIDTSITTVSSCESFIWNGTSLNTSGIYYNHFSSISGCDSVAKLILTINHTIYIETYDTICVGQIFTLPWGIVVNATGVYRDTLLYTTGCDSVRRTIHLTVQPFTVQNTYPVICSGQTYTLPWGALVNTTGVYHDTLHYVTGCDSVRRNVSLMVQNFVSQNFSGTFCTGSNYTLPWGVVVNATGVYHDTLHYTTGCDSVRRTVTVTEQTYQTLETYDTICVGQIFTLPWGIVVNATGVYRDTLHYTTGCDSVRRTIHLTVQPFTVQNTYPIICSGQTYTLPWGAVVNTTGVYHDTLHYVTGCDSVRRNVSLTVQNVVNQNFSGTFCTGSNYTLPWGVVVNATGVYHDTLHYTTGCDSVRRTVTVTEQTYQTLETYDTICVGQTFTLPWGVVVNATGVYRDTLHYTTGCDSVRRTVYLKVQSYIVKVKYDTICTGHTYLLPWGVYTNLSGTYMDTLHYTTGCDSVRRYVFLTVLPPKYENTDASICDYENYLLPWGVSVNQAGTYIDTVVTPAGCDSVVRTYNITVKPSPQITLSKFNDINCIIGTSRLLASGASLYQWSPSSSLNNAGIANPIAAPTVTTLYHVQATGINGCVSNDSIRVVVLFDHSEDAYPVPSAFTPNKDGTNDCFGVSYWGRLNEFSMSIYNRWSEKVFFTTDINKCWDGKYKGMNAEMGTYVYVIEGKGSCGKIFKKGTVVLIR